MLEITEDQFHASAPRRVLLVEDNYLVASGVQCLLETLGYVVVGPVPSLGEGLDLAADRSLAGAVLDINILGGSSEKIALLLRQRQCPFVFISGYDSPDLLQADLRDHARLAKPLDTNLFAQTIREHFHQS